MTTAYLVRHAEVNQATETPVPAWTLSSRGWEQARAISRGLQQCVIAAIYSSPAVRCLQTVEPLAGALRLPIFQDSRLRERELGVNRVRDYPAVRMRSWRDFNYAPPGGESFWDCQKRVTAALMEIFVAHRGETIVVSGHGNTIGLFLNAFCPPFELREALGIASPDIIELRHRGSHLHTGWEYVKILELLGTLAR